MKQETVIVSHYTACYSVDKITQMITKKISYFYLPDENIYACHFVIFDSILFEFDVAVEYFC